jgi:ABC-type lipoprotein release transport system permease subunit
MLAKVQDRQRQAQLSGILPRQATNRTLGDVEFFERLGVMSITRLMTSLLFDVSPLDPLTYLAVALLLTTAAATASCVPARRASTVPLIEVLAAE